MHSQHTRFGHEQCSKGLGQNGVDTYGGDCCLYLWVYQFGEDDLRKLSLQLQLRFLVFSTTASFSGLEDRKTTIS